MYQFIYYMPKLKHTAVTCAVPTKNNKITSVTKIVDIRKSSDDYNSNKINNFWDCHCKFHLRNNMMHRLQWMALVHPNYGLPQQLIFTILACTGVPRGYEVTCCKLEVMRSNPTWVYLCPMSCSGCGATRGIVVVGMDPWIPWHVSTSPAPVVDCPSYKKKIISFILKGCF